MGAVTPDAYLERVRALLPALRERALMLELVEQRYQGVVVADRGIIAAIYRRALQRRARDG